MKKRLSIWIAIACMSGGIAASAQYMQSADSVLVLNKEKALTIALSENPTIKIADIEIKKKDYTKRESIAGLLPQIDAAAS